MSVSLCALRLELGGDSIVPKNFNYLGIQTQTLNFSMTSICFYDFLWIFAAPQYSTMATGSAKDNSEPKERLPEAESWERDRAGKCRGKRELHTIEMETYVNENGAEGTPWVSISTNFRRNSE